jgi:hypothetical protein
MFISMYRKHAYTSDLEDTDRYLQCLQMIYRGSTKWSRVVLCGISNIVEEE